MEKLIITIAPTGNVPTKEMTPYVPVTAAEIVADVEACFAAGAAVAHLHARDEVGAPTHRVEVFQKIVAALDASGCPIVRQLSTGARAARTGEERAEVLALTADSASLATGSSNFPRSANVNEPALIEHLAKEMIQKGIKPECEVFDAAMVPNAVSLAKEGLLQEPLVFNLVLGVKGALPATARNLLFLVESLPPGAVWSVAVVGPQHVPLSMMAMALGGHVRVGVEDNIYYEKGVLATNAMLVKRIASLASAMGRDLATPVDVRRIWGVEGGL